MEQDISRKERVDEEIRQMKFDAGNNDSGKYKVETIRDSAVYLRESESGYLPGLYHLVSWKSYLEEKNIWEPASAVQHLRKLISSFYKDRPDKLTAISLAIITAPLMARLTVKLTAKLTEPPKQKRRQLANSTNKRAKKNWAAFDFYRIFGQIQVTLNLTSSVALHMTARDCT